MFSKKAGKIDATCSEIIFPEFADLLFCTALDKICVFDATHYIESSKSKKTVEEFFDTYSSQIKSLLLSYADNSNFFYYINKDGHVLIDNKLCFLFLMYCDETFLRWCIEKIHDLFGSGIALSDNMLISHLVGRFSLETINQIYNNDEFKRQ